MEVYQSLEHIPDLPAPVVTMGSFDGVHAGHRVIIRRLNQLARQAGGCSVLITFHPHPRKVLYPETAGKDLKLISTLEEKYTLLSEAGLDHLLVLEFTREFAKTSSEEFVRKILVACLHAHTIVVGFNHFFGHNKEGSFESLYRVSEQYGFRVEEIPEQEIQNESVSSTRIRKALREGHIQRANAYLEHFFMLTGRYGPGEVASGGHACLKIEVRDEVKLLPPPGMYAVSFQHGTELLKGLLRISGEDIYLYPLEDLEEEHSARACVYFHKHLDVNVMSKLPSALEAVRELVY